MRQGLNGRLGVAAVTMLSLGMARPEQPHPLQVARSEAAISPIPADSIAYQVLPASRLEVTTGKAGLLGFAGHRHLIRARGFSGQVVHYPNTPASSHLEVKVATDSLEVLTPPDTAEIRKVTESMRTEVLHVAQYPEIRLVSKTVTPTAGGFRLVGALTLVGQTREVPIDVTVEFSADTLRARTKFSVKQTDFGIRPYRGGPGGTVKVADEVTFDVEIIAVRTGGIR
jgi:polyisoprenoid-binding protein YceI